MVANPLLNVMADYSKAKIYRICAPGCDDVYIGSTTREINRRFQLHKSYFKNYGPGKQYYSSFEILKHQGAYVELIEEFPCRSRAELCRREGEIISATANCVNSQLAGRTDQEWNAANRERIANQKRLRYIARKDEINSRRRELYAKKMENKL